MSTQSGPAGKAGSTTPGRARNALLQSLAQLSVRTTGGLLESLFGSCDDLFFDLASQAKSNQDQNLYFESLREVRQRKAALVEDFGKRIARGFVEFDRPARITGTALSGHTADSLELVGRNQAEKDALVTDMVSKARLEWQQELFQLNERLRAIMPRPFEDPDSPLDPRQIASAFATSGETLDLDLKVVKLLYRQFDRMVMRELEDLYHDANQLLIEAGVLPRLSPLARRRIKKNELPQAAARHRSSAEGDATGLEGLAEADPGMRELAHLLGRLRSGGVRLPMFPNLSPAGTAPQIPREQLVSLLSDVQAQALQQPDADKPIDIRSAVDAIISARGQFTVGSADEDIINLVAMFFDLVLEDRNLPLEIQALVSRLQLPILKVALKDRSFFTNRKHPARQLINQIAHVGVGWDTSSADAQEALYIRLTELVEEVLRNSSEHADVFDRCLTDLVGFIERSEQRAAKSERRTSEKAQAEARTSKARDMVRHALQERLEGKELPAAVSEFLIEDWQQVLQLVFLKQGKETPEWIDAVQVVDDLVWSVQTHADGKSQARMTRLLPELYPRIAAGLGLTRSSAEDAQERINMLREVHQALAVPTPETTVLMAPLTPVQQERIAPAATDEKSWHEMTAVERQKVQFEALMYEYLKRANETPVGTWFEYDDLRRAVTRRCKLSVRIEDSGMLLFVNRLGVPVYEKPPKAFAYDLQMGYARVIEDAPLFDRTLERISGNLRKLVGQE